MDDDIIDAIRKVSNAVVEVGNPVIVVTGKVESVNPLKIRIDQKTLLTRKMLRLTWAVVDHQVDITVDHFTELDNCALGGPHSHRVLGRKTIIIHNNLLVGEAVLLVRDQGGQKYTVVA